jgi:hypothetical protein
LGNKQLLYFVFVSPKKDNIIDKAICYIYENYAMGNRDSTRNEAVMDANSRPPPPFDEKSLKCSGNWENFVKPPPLQCI